MEELSLEEKVKAGAKRAHKLLSWESKERDLTVRDDQYDFPWLMDLVKSWRKSKRRLRLIDSGKMNAFQLEWLGQAGADIYTSDVVRAKTEELDLIYKACQKGRAVMACFLQRPLREEQVEGYEGFSFSDLVDMGRWGIYFYLSNREREHEFSLLNELGYACRRGGSWLVYYHHGLLESSLEEIARNGSWIHVSDRSINETEDIEILMETIKASFDKRAHVVVHIERKWDSTQLQDILKAGAYVLFKSFPSDYKSPLRPLEEKAGKKKLDFRAYYLYPNFLL